MQNKTHPIRLLLPLFLALVLATACGPAAPAPYQLSTGWQTSIPAEQGLDAGRLEAMQAAVAGQGLDLHSLLVVRNGYIVQETYFNSFQAGSKHELFSCTKSFIATLVGIAIDQGYLAGVDAPVSDFFAGRIWQNGSPSKDRLTVEDLLTMTSGLDWQEGDPTYRQMYISADWVQFVLDLPMAGEPGGAFNYCSGCSHVLSAILAEATGMSTQEFARQRLFAPLGIADFSWESDRDGLAIGGWGLQLTPRDMAKLGYLYLKAGEWDGQQVVSSGWVQAAVTKHTSTDGELGYGYQWWVYPEYNAYAALGRGGQTIFVLPELQLVVVATAGSAGHEAIFQLIEEYVITAVDGG